MPPHGRPEIDALRETIARIEHGRSNRPGDTLGRNFVASASENNRRTFNPKQTDDLSAGHILHRVETRGMLNEIVAARAGDGPAASGFALALAIRFAARFRPGAPILWIVEDHAQTETGSLYAPGLAAHGLDPAKLILVETANGQDSLWAMEEALKCSALAVVGAEIWRLKSYDLTASRRLVLAAQQSGTPGLLVAAGLAGAGDQISSAAQARLEVRTRPSPILSSAARRTPLPGCAAWDIRALRIRAGPDGARLNFDSDRFWPLLWDHEEALFRDAFPLSVSPPARDGHDHAQARNL